MRQSLSFVRWGIGSIAREPIFASKDDLEARGVQPEVDLGFKLRNNLRECLGERRDSPVII